MTGTFGNLVHRENSQLAALKFPDSDGNSADKGLAAYKHLTANHQALCAFTQANKVALPTWPCAELGSMMVNVKNQLTSHLYT